MRCTHYGVDALVKGENRVLRREFTRAGNNHLVEESDILGAHHLVVAIHVAQSEDVILAGSYVAQGELATAVGAAHAVEG